MNGRDVVAESSSFRHPRPRLLRVWHWLSALAILGAMGTVVLRKTFLSWRTNSQLIESRLAELGVTISRDDAVALAREIRAPMWEWHYIIGFALTGLLLLRGIIALLDPTQAPVRTTWGAFRGWSRVASIDRRGYAHVLMVKVTYIVFYVMLAFMVVSGLSMYYADTLGLSDALAGSVKNIHELAMWFFAAFVAAHIGGVVLSELRGERGLVSDMINGGDARSKGSDDGA